MSGKRVAKNTLFQIVKMLITTVVNLYMVRVLLHQLGVEAMVFSTLLPAFWR